ncbi:protein of unknown function [Cognatiyoonia koreensis]|uniref:DUF4440 domain-containing protein n=1 Tax=Cognatiyoonia koreensis TaxID=364200 RepID=A0A1I0NUV0_9RHOB|nr:nuclear transport factor 2 family protein [Cognatiyoonia koreensis]SEW05340.1 protein of unknown function [Cognatiyoonia koreensis]
MTDTFTLENTILAHERKVWDALVAGEMAADADALSADFLGVYPDGFAGKADHVGQLKDGPTVAEYEITAPQIRPLGPDTVLLAYHATFRRPSETQMKAMYVSSIWQAQGATRVNIFSQDTPA